MMKKSAIAVVDDSSAFRDDYLASSYPSSSSSSSSSLRDGNKKSTSSVASAANNAPLRRILTRILESRDNEGYNCTILESRGENDDERDGLLLPPPAPPSSSSTTTTTADDPLRGISAGYNRVGDDSNSNNRGVGRDHRTPPPSKGKNRDRNDDEGTKEEGAEVTVETYSASPLLRRSHERALERRSFMEEMRKTLPMIPATKSEYAREGEGRTMREDRERDESKKAATTSSEQDEPPRPTSMRMKKLWDFGDPEQRPHRAETLKDNIIGVGVRANEDYCDLNYHTSSNDVDDVARAEHDKYDDDGATWSLSRIRRESRRLLTRQARDDLLEVERFTTDMKGRMESLRRLQLGREVREESGEGQRRQLELELKMKSERIIATATATTATNASTTSARKWEEDADDDIESLARRLQIAAKARSSPTIRGGRQSKITGGDRDISDSTNDPRDGAGLRRFRQSRKGEEEEDKRERVLQRPTRQRSRVIDERDYDGSSKSAISRTTESSSKSSPSGLDLERWRSEHTKKERGGEGGDTSDGSGGIDERLDSWWRMQQLRRRHEKQRGADTPIFKELVGEPTVAEVDSSASTITRIGQKQHLLHQRGISDVVGVMPPLSPPSNTASSSPTSADTVKTPPSGTTPEMAKLSRHEPSRSSLRSGLQQSKSISNDSSNIRKSRTSSDITLLPSSPIISVSSNSRQTSSDLSATVKYAARRSSICAMTPERHENKATYFPTRRNTGKIASDSIRSNNENSSDGQMPPPWLTTTTSKTSSSSTITGSVVNTANINDITHITRRRMRTRTSTSSPASSPALAKDNGNVNGDNKHEKLNDGTKNGDRVADGSTLSVLLRGIEETKSGFTRALLDGNVEEQTNMANLMMTLGEAAMTFRKLETTNE